jgi:hypothetical protein
VVVSAQTRIGQEQKEAFIKEISEIRYSKGEIHLGPAKIGEELLLVPQ